MTNQFLRSDLPFDPVKDLAIVMALVQGSDFLYASPKLAATNVKDLDARIAQLTKGLTPTNQKVVKLIEERRAAFPKAVTDVAAGQKVFATNCMVCHSINNTGGKVGPNLDGVGNRGTDRLMEDVLDPNRNVDPAFRYSNVFTKDGDVVTGLFRREEAFTSVVQRFARHTPCGVLVRTRDAPTRAQFERAAEEYPKLFDGRRGQSLGPLVGQPLRHAASVDVGQARLAPLGHDVASHVHFGRGV